MKSDKVELGMKMKILSPISSRAGKNLAKWFHGAPDAFAVLGRRGVWGSLEQREGWLPRCSEAAGSRVAPHPCRLCTQSQPLPVTGPASRSLSTQRPESSVKESSFLLWCLLTMTSQLTSLDQYLHFSPLLYSTAKNACYSSVQRSWKENERHFDMAEVDTDHS